MIEKLLLKDEFPLYSDFTKARGIDHDQDEEEDSHNRRSELADSLIKIEDLGTARSG